MILTCSILRDIGTAYFSRLTLRLSDVDWSTLTFISLIKMLITLPTNWTDNIDQVLIQLFHVPLNCFMLIFIINFGVTMILCSINHTSWVYRWLLILISYSLIIFLHCRIISFIYMKRFHLKLFFSALVFYRPRVLGTNCLINNRSIILLYVSLIWIKIV